MIIVEGPDGSGKTTLIKLLKDELNIPVAPRVVSKETKAMTNLQDWVDNNLDEGFQKVIFDRYRLISEPIYGPILRKGQSEGFDSLMWLGPRLKRFYELEPIIIYCLPHLFTVVKNIGRDHDNDVVRPHIQAIYTAYVAKAAMDYALAPGRVHVWDYEHSPQVMGRPIWLPTIKEELKKR